MYQFERFHQDQFLVTHSQTNYREWLPAESEADAIRQVCELNQPEYLAQLAARRYEVETGGIDINGLHVETDRQAQAQMNSAYGTLQAGFVETTDWKGVNGWQEVTLDTIAPLASAVAKHVARCFTAERRADEALRDITTVEELERFDIAAKFDEILDTL